MKKILSSIAMIMFILAGSVSGALVSSQTTHAATCGQGGIPLFPSWYDGLCDTQVVAGGPTGTTTQVKIKSPSDFGGQDGTGGLSKFITIIALNIVNMLLYAVGYVSLAFIIFGGFKYMTSGDSSNGTSAAKSTILNAVIGMILAIMSVGIVNFVVGSIK